MIRIVAMFVIADLHILYAEPRNVYTCLLSDFTLNLIQGPLTI